MYSEMRQQIFHVVAGSRSLQLTASGRGQGRLFIITHNADSRIHDKYDCLVSMRAMHVSCLHSGCIQYHRPESKQQGR